MDMGDMSWLGASASLPEFETELQKIVADEKVRSEQHKINYQQLKLEHSKLQEEYVAMQNRLKETVEQSHLVQERYRILIDEGKRSLLERQAELNDAQSHAITPQKMEAIRLQLVEEVEQPFKERLIVLEHDVEEATTKYNKLRYDMSFLAAEYEHDKSEHEQIINELKLQYEAELKNLRSERDALLTKMQTEGAQDVQRVRACQRENAQLSVRNKNLQAELEDIRAAHEKLSFDMDQLVRAHDKQVSEQSALIQASQAEKESLKKQISLIQEEFAVTSNTHEKLTNHVHELEKDKSSLGNRINELIHKHKMDMSNLRMDMLKQRGETERERDDIANRLEDMSTQLDVARHKVMRQERLLMEKDNECVQRVQAVRDEEWAKNAALENEKLEVETKLQEMMRLRVDDDALKQSVQDRYEDRLKSANELRESAEREVVIVKAQLNMQETMQANLDEAQCVVSRLKSRIGELEGNVAKAQENEQEMLDVISRLKSQNQHLADETRSSRQQLETMHDRRAHLSSQQQAAGIDETKNDTAMQQMSVDLTACRSKLSNVIKQHQKHKKKCLQVIHKLKDRLQIQKAKIEELRIARLAYQNFVSPDILVKVQRQLKDLQRRNAEFRKIIYSGTQQTVTIGDRPFTRMVHACSSNNTVFEDEQHEIDIQQLKRRLASLDNFQQQQLDKLRDVTSAVNTTHYDPQLNRANNAIQYHKHIKLDSITPISSLKCPQYDSIKMKCENLEEKEGEELCKAKMDVKFKSKISENYNDHDVEISDFVHAENGANIIDCEESFSKDRKDSSMISTDRLKKQPNDARGGMEGSALLSSVENEGNAKRNTMQTEESGCKSHHSESHVSEENVREEVKEEISLISGDEYSSHFDNSVSDEEKW